MMEQRQFTRYEIARITGARALQVAMDAPILIKISEEELKIMKYDSLKIAELEFSKNALPISISRPMPLKRSEKLKPIKEEKVEDAEIIAREEEEEKDIVASAEAIGLVQEDDVESDVDVATPSATEEQ